MKQNSPPEENQTSAYTHASDGGETRVTNILENISQNNFSGVKYVF